MMKGFGWLASQSRYSVVSTFKSHHKVSEVNADKVPSRFHVWRSSHRNEIASLPLFSCSQAVIL